MKSRNNGRLPSNYQESSVAKRRRVFLLIVDSLQDDMANRILDAIDFFTDAYFKAYPDVLVCTCRDMATDYVITRVIQILAQKG